MNDRHDEKLRNREHVGDTRPIAPSAQLDAAGSSHGEKGSGMRLLSKSTMTLALTLLISLFMYGGWFAPESSHANLVYVGGASGSGTGATYNVSLTGLTGGTGSAAQAGDLVIVVTGWASAADGNPGVTTAGYTEVYDGFANDTRFANFSVNWKIMGGSPDTSVTVSGFNNAANGGATVVQVWRGADPLNPMDVAAPSAPLGVSGINASRPNSPPITPVTTGAVVIAVGLGTGAAAPTAMTAPTGFINGLSATGAGSTMGAVANIASQAWAGGAVDPAAWTGGGTATTDSWVAGTLALRPLVLIDALSVTSNTAIATSASLLATGVQMQMLRVDCSSAGNSSCSINSITVDDLGSVGATDITNLHIYIDTDSTFAGAVGPITQAGFSGSSTAVSLLSWTTERIVTSGTSKYLWIVYDLAASANAKTIQSSVTAIAVASPDTGAVGTWSSNIVNVTSGPASTINSCAGCHGYPSPLSDGTARNTPQGQFVGDHAKHNYACSTCHVIPATETGVDFAHRDGNINIKSGSIGLADNGTYSRGSTFAQSNSPTTGTCNSVSCHANAVTPQWGVGVTACDTCHALPPATNAHTKHYSEKGWATGSNAMCIACHPSNLAGHSNVTDNVVEVTLTLTPAGVSPAITCASATASGCHIDKTTPAWNTTNIACLACHTLGGASNNPTSGLHNVVPSITGQQHDNSFGTGGTCTSCHTTLNAQSTHANSIFSANGAIPGDKTAMGLAAFYTATADNTGSCSNTSCHISFSDDWAHQWYPSTSNYTTNGSSCGGCHGDWVRGWNTGVIHRTTANTRSTHGDGGTNYECYECHTLEHAVYPFTWITNDWLPAGGTSRHGNSAIEVNSSGTTYNTTSGYCTACHVSGIFNFSDTSWTINSVAGATVVSTCFSCHGGDNATIGNTNYWPGGVGASYPDRTGEHNAHIQALAARLGYPFNGTLTDQQQKTMCAYCHTYTTAPGEAGHGDNVAPANVTGTAFNPMWSTLTANYPSTADAGTAAAYTAGNGVNGTCAGIDCHNNKSTTTAYDWYDGAATACIMCHSDTSADASHVAHTGAQATYGGAAIICTTCHGAGTTTTTAPTTGHINGTFAVAGTTSFTYTGVYPTKGTCGTNQCHNNGKNAATPAYTWATPLTGCAQCHGDTSANLTSQAHVAHLTANTTFGITITCGRCHAAATATTHFDGTITMPGTTAFTYTGDVLVSGTTFGSCGTSNCHRSDASANAAPAVNPAWNAGALANCSICHLEAMVTNKHNQHLTSNALPNATNVNECFNCHNSTATAAGLASGANHINSIDDVNFTAATNYEAGTAARASTGATTTCSNVKCHSGITTPQWSATVSCFSCHNTGGTGPLPSAASVIGKHPQHANNDAVYTDCALCHQNAASYTAVGGHLDHQNLTVNVTMAGITYTEVTGGGGVNYAATDFVDNGTCASTTGCHGASTLTGGWAASATLANGCFACHGNSLTAAETGTTKPAVDAIPNPVNFTNQYAVFGHGRTSATNYTGSNSPGANLTGYTGAASPGCYSCHSSAAPHTPGASATDPFRLGVYANNIEGLCSQASCHPAAEIQTHKKSIIGGTTTWVNNYDFKCTDCHDPHGDTNFYMVRSHISAPTLTTDTSFGSDVYGTPQDTANISAITFTSLTGNATNSYGVNTATNGICEVCHIDTTEVAYYRRNVAETNTHNPTGKCTSCHTHLAGFKGAGCNGCHGGDNATVGNVNFWPGAAGVTYPDRTGEHNIHIQRLATRLGYPFNNTLTDQQQKTMCGYCHNYTTEPGESGHDLGGAPADVGSFNPMWSALTANYPSTTDNGVYTPGNGTNGSCATVDCHNNITNPVTHEWYDNSTSNCVMCHTRATSGNNPSSGLHFGSTAPTVSGVWHDNTLNGNTNDCLPCHTMPAYSQAGTHLNGTFTGNGTLAANRTNMGLFASYTNAGTDGQGSCSGAGVGAGCHNPTGGDNGTWARRWNSATHYATIASFTPCAGCHGGFGANDWTFGADNVVGDASVSHNRNWDGDANTSEVIGNHSTSTNATKCNSCHVYGDANYVWGTHHRNNQITMNSTAGYQRTTTTPNYGCTVSCHASNVNHGLEVSTWTLGTLAGPALSCVGCHSSIYQAGAGTHIDADGPGTAFNTGTTVGLCEACHGTGTGTIVGHWVLQGAAGTNRIGISTLQTRTVVGTGEDTGTLIPTMNRQYSTHDSYILLGGTATNSATTEAQMCWGCHDAVTTASYTLTGTNVTFTNPATIAATNIGTKFPVGRWITIFGSSNVSNNRTFRVATSTANSITVTIPAGSAALASVASAAGVTIVSPISEWQVNQNTVTGALDYDYGMLFTDANTVPGTRTSDWTTGFWRSGKGLRSGSASNPAWYKRGAIQSTHTANIGNVGGTGVSTVTAGNSLGYNRTETKDSAALIRCSNCHDVHGTHDGVNGDVAGKPFLRGTWKGNPYAEDIAPRWGMANWTYPTNYGLVPRASNVATNSGLATVARAGGFWIDQNSGNPNSGSSATATAGLCDQCHSATRNGTWTAAEIGAIDQVTGEALWISGFNGHANAVISGAGGDNGTAPAAASAERRARNIFNRTMRGSASLTDTNANKATMNMGAVGVGQGYTYRGAGSGYIFYPRVMNTTELGTTAGRPYAFNNYVWSTGTPIGLTQNLTIGAEPAHDAQLNYHTFNCAKCHNPHASRLPKLMITNCLDANHNDWEDKSTFTGSALPAPWTGTRHSQWATAQNCHRLDSRAALATGPVNTLGPGWNKATPWQEQLTPNATITSDPNP